MYLVEVLDKSKWSRQRPFGPGLTKEQIAVTNKVEVWGTNFNDPGPDHTEFRVFNSYGTMHTYSYPGF